MDGKLGLRHDKSKVNLRIGEPPKGIFASSSQPEILGAPFKTYLQHKTVRLPSEEDCPLCQQHIKQKAMPKLIHKALFSKYSNSITYFFTKGVNDILAGNKSRALVDFIEDSYWLPDKECIVGFVPRANFQERFQNLWKYHQFNIDQPRHDSKGITEVLETFFNGKRKIQEKAIKKMLEVMTDSELENCEIHLSQFAGQPLEIFERPIDDSERVIPKALTGERKASSISLSIIENISKGGKSVKPEDYLRHQIFRGPRSYMVFDWGDKDLFSDISKLFRSKPKNSFYDSNGEWPSFIEPSEQRKLDDLISEENTEFRAPHKTKQIEKNFIKKGYKEIIGSKDQSKLKSKSKKKTGFLGVSDRGNVIPLVSKTKQNRELIKIDKLSKEKEFKKSSYDQATDEGSFHPSRNFLPPGSKEIKIRENVISELKKSSVNNTALTLALKGKRRVIPSDIYTPVRKLMDTFKNSMRTNTNEDTKKSRTSTKSVPKSVSRSRSIKHTVTEPKLKVVLPDSIHKILSSEKKQTQQLTKKSKEINRFPMTQRELSNSIQKKLKQPLESSSVKSLGLHTRKFDSSAKRLKTRPVLGQEQQSSNPGPSFIGYDPFIQNTNSTSSPRGMAFSTMKKNPKIDGSKINIYTSGFMHKIILSKRNQLSETKLSSSDLKQPSSQQLTSMTSRPRLRHGSSGNHTLQLSSNQLLRQGTGKSPPNASPRSLSRNRLHN